MMDPTELVKALDQRRDDFSADEQSLPNAQRLELIMACKNFIQTAQSPIERAADMIFSIHPFTAVRVGMKIGVFDAALGFKSSPFTVEQLATATGKERLLIVRFMRVLANIGLFREVGPYLYETTRATAIYSSQSLLTGPIIHFHDTHGKILLDLPKYIESIGFRSPFSYQQGPFQYAFPSSPNIWVYRDENPEEQKAFNDMMEVQRQATREKWFEYFPVEERLPNNRDLDTPLLVDVGGRFGDDIVALKARFPNLDGPFVVQDSAEVVKEAYKMNLSSLFTLSAYDLFDKQPVLHAKAYVLTKVLHDWPDSEALQILHNTTQAMSSKSLLLLNEIVLPDAGVSLTDCYHDLTMMASFAALERTKKQWEDLLASAGLEIVAIHEPKFRGPVQPSLIEARLLA